MANYDQDVLDAEADIREDGELVSVVKLANWTGSKPWRPQDPTEAEYEDVPLLYIPDGSAEWRAYTSGTDVPKGSTLALMPGNVPFVPELGMMINSPSRGALRIAKADKLAPGSQTIMYTLRLEQ